MSISGLFETLGHFLIISQRISAYMDKNCHVNLQMGEGVVLPCIWNITWWISIKAEILQHYIHASYLLAIWYGGHRVSSSDGWTTKIFLAHDSDGHMAVWQPFRKLKIPCCQPVLERILRPLGGFSRMSLSIPRLIVVKSKWEGKDKEEIQSFTTSCPELQTE